MPATAQVPTGEPEAVPTKRDLTSWWRSFTRNNAKKPENTPGELPEAQGIFGVDLQKSIRYANVAISLVDADGQPFTYGYVPIVVAKCGVFLKERATETQGIFRLAGAERRVKELQKQFDTPERYGKGLDWEGYTVHDAAGVLRRYFNSLPEPVIPWPYYDKFRNPLIGHQAQAVGAMPSQRPTEGEFNYDGAIKTYQTLITQLPPLNRQLLLYILDLLAVFAAKSEANSMDASNLAVIFQPGILHHTDHNMSPDEYRLNQDVLIFLIENQDHFLVGMEGTAVDEKTIADVQSGKQQQAQQAAGNVNGGVTTSAGADQLKKSGGLRRNVSVSSRRSRQSATASPSPVTPPPDGGFVAGGKSGVSRSNTVPSRKSGSPVVTGQKSPLGGPPTRRGDGGSQASTPALSSATQPRQPRSERERGGQAPYPSGRMSPHLRPVPTAKERARSQERKPNKLQKKRADKALSAHSSTQSLGVPLPTSPSAAPWNRAGERYVPNLTDAQRLEAFDPAKQELPEPQEYSLNERREVGESTAGVSGKSPRASMGSEGAGGYSSTDNLSEGAKKHSRWNFSISRKEQKEKGGKSET